MDPGSSLWPSVCGIKTAIVQVAMHLQHGHKTRMSGPPAQHGSPRPEIMKKEKSRKPQAPSIKLDSWTGIL